MKSKFPFTIVNRPDDVSLPRSVAESSLQFALKKSASKLATSLDSIPAGLREALLSSTDLNSVFQPQRNKQSKDRTQVDVSISPEIVDVVNKLSTSSSVATVGILDLGAWVSRIPQLLQVMNRAQNRLIFLEIQTPVPAGLIKTKEPLVEWAKRNTNEQLTEKDISELDRNMLAHEFYYFAETVRKQHHLDVLVGLTPAMIAFLDEDGPQWNYYAAGEQSISLVSTYDLRGFSATAGRPYEAAVGMLIATQVFALRNNIDYHKETRGCIFDFNEARGELVDSIKSMKIEESCLSLFEDPLEAKSAKALISALARMKESSRG